MLTDNCFFKTNLFKKTQKIKSKVNSKCLDAFLDSEICSQCDSHESLFISTSTTKVGICLPRTVLILVSGVFDFSGSFRNKSETSCFQGRLWLFGIGGYLLAKVLLGY